MGLAGAGKEALPVPLSDDPENPDGPGPDPYDEALRLLVRREHSRLELVRKLQARAFATDRIEHSLDLLAEEGAQSDERFASEYALSRARRGFGPDRIRHELRERGIGQCMAREALEELGGDWFTLMEAARGKRFGTDLPKDFQSRSKQIRFLLNRGFPMESIRELLG